MACSVAQRRALAKARAAKKRKHRGGKKGDKSKTHKGDLDYTTKRGDKDFHRKGHDVHKKRRPYRKRK
ncbi:MAG: hypothetical protein CMQ40_12225 [Gammaproteobacteria bacterium]|nr:hypothetical protein [Gammaproteobacteria bacterium]|tara:strand:+ start:381 stop:584 length:204 start_codon:yes stop_codon:yes gene_type:complete